MTTLDKKNYIETIISKLENCSGSSATIHDAKKYITILNGALQLSSMYPDSEYNTDEYIDRILKNAINFMKVISRTGE